MRKSFLTWGYHTAKHAEWETFAEVRATYKSADSVNQFVVFDVGHNRFRIITVINMSPGLSISETS